MCREPSTQLKVDFQSETLKTRRQCNHVFKVMGEKAVDQEGSKTIPQK